MVRVTENCLIGTSFAVFASKFQRQQLTMVLCLLMILMGKHLAKSSFDTCITSSLCVPKSDGEMVLWFPILVEGLRALKAVALIAWSTCNFPRVFTVDLPGEGEDVAELLSALEGDVKRNCVQCKQMYGHRFAGKMCGDTCIASNGEFLLDCNNPGMIHDYLKRLYKK
ncbi:hypothetical protein HUJ05_002444 [Dendroctonus ponderosae]|nr:hypothetical protein HUJ05_002444 [Dendroctonus ponderosae]